MTVMPPPIVRTAYDLRRQSRNWKAQGGRVALVPTMGALHAGHLSLVERAKRGADRVVVSIFVNPAQFAPHEDFDKYPRAEAADLAVLAAQGLTDMVYAPTVSQMYPSGFSTSVSVGGPALGLESDARPHFFAGVATVVAKLFAQCEPDLAVFGEKDFQQLAVVRRVARDLDLPIEVQGAPTLRESDGLALSSRNAYLAPQQRAIAGSLNKIMIEVAARTRAGVSAPAAAAQGKIALLDAGFDQVDYLEVRDEATLSTALKPDRPARVLVAARLGGVRLIDNCPV